MRQALSVWPRIALLSFGSPAVQLAAMYRILVEEKRWISRGRFLNALNYCLALPGPDAQLLAAYVGWIMHGTLGGMLAGGLVILPPMICMMALSYGYVSGGDSTIGEVLLYGLKPAILVIVLEATIRVGRQVLRTRLMVALAALAFVGTFFLQSLLRACRRWRRRDRLLRCTCGLFGTSGCGACSRCLRRVRGVGR